MLRKLWLYITDYVSVGPRGRVCPCVGLGCGGGMTGQLQELKAV